jgi:cellobiose phosphorylase
MLGSEIGGRERAITTPSGQITPTPRVNALANLQFGSIASESGLLYS